MCFSIRSSSEGMRYGWRRKEKENENLNQTQTVEKHSFPCICTESQVQQHIVRVFIITDSAAVAVFA